MHLVPFIINAYHSFPSPSHGQKNRQEQVGSSQPLCFSVNKLPPCKANTSFEISMLKLFDKMHWYSEQLCSKVPKEGFVGKGYVECQCVLLHIFIMHAHAHTHHAFFFFFSQSRQCELWAILEWQEHMLTN